MTQKQAKVIARLIVSNVIDNLSIPNILDDGYNMDHNIINQSSEEIDMITEAIEEVGRKVKGKLSSKGVTANQIINEVLKTCKN